jgi:Uma2 family endonuclease
MRALLLEVPQAMLDERRRLGHDKHDEMWDGVLHMVPPAGGPHQKRGSRLVSRLLRLAEPLGLDATYETGVFEPGRNDNYRVPDNVVFRPSSFSERGVEGRAELVVELRSANDESYEKLPFYASMEVQEVLILDKSMVDLRHLVDGVYVPTEPDSDGWFAIRCVPMKLRGAADGQIEVAWADQVELM